VTWSIEDSAQSKASAATVSETGILTGIIGAITKAELTAGGAKIIVVATSKVDPTMNVKKAVFVKYAPTTTVTLIAANSETTIAVSGSIQLTTAVLPTNACPVVTYTTSDATVLLVSATGLVSVPAGSEKYETATIRATSLDNIIGTYDITVLDPNA
jgi:hypothetical protein